MTITYPEGGMPGLVLRQRTRRPAIDTFKVQLVPLRSAPKTKIGGPEDVAKLVKEMEDYDRESAKIIHLDTKNQVMGIETISIGSLTMSIIHPRETVKGAILNNSANVIFVHNHPSGICGPSREDLEISGKLKEVFDLVNITMLDSIIVGKGCHYSLRESGYITGKTEHASSQMVAEPKAETKEKVQFITAVTDYINSGADLERRKRSGEKIQASRYFKPWFEEFFYEHDRENAKKKLMKLFGANEQGIQLVNHTYYGVLSDYLNAIAKPALMVRENTTPLILHIKQEIKAIHYLALQNDPSATRRGENTIEWIDSGVTAGNITPEQARDLKEAVKHALDKGPYLKIAKLIEKTSMREPGIEDYIIKKEYLKTLGLTEYYIDLKEHARANIREEEFARASIIENKENKTIEIHSIYVPKSYQGKGIGKVLITEILKDVDAKCMKAIVKPAGEIDSPGYLKLKNYYAQFGFSIDKELSEGPDIIIMSRKPKCSSLNGSKMVNNIEAFLNRLTVDTSRYSRSNQIPDSAVIGAAIPGDGFLFAYHVTDDPEGTMRKLKSNIPLCQMNTTGDLGCGFYVSGVPQYWRGRSTAKWEFARNLNRAQRQALVTVILSDPNYRKGGGYLADFEVDYLTKDLKQFVDTGDVNVLAMTGNQPYNVHITNEISRRAGVPIPKEPGLIKVKLQGKFINASELYSNAEIVSRAQAWAVISRPKLLEWNKRASTQNIVNAWLCSEGYSGAFTKSGFSTNPEMVIWGRKAIIGMWIPEPQT